MTSIILLEQTVIVLDSSGLGVHLCSVLFNINVKGLFYDHCSRCVTGSSVEFCLGL